MSPGPEFGMDGKLNQAQKINNKAEGTPKTEAKSKVCVQSAQIILICNILHNLFSAQ